MASGQRIEADKIGAPFQLLAASMVFIILLDSSFLGAAAVLERPSWAAAALTIAAIANPPLLLTGVFVLQTRYREQLLADEPWVQVQKVATELRASVEATGIDPTTEDLVRRAIHLTPEQQVELQARVRKLEQTISAASGEEHERRGAIAQASRELAHAALAQHRWLEAADRLKAYLDFKPDDWEEWFLQGNAFANARQGETTDQAAVHSYGEAIRRMPAHETSGPAARAHSYRAGVLKRLGRLQEAKEDLRRADALAVASSYEADDINYNLAAILAMEGDRDGAVEALRRIVDHSYVAAAAAHQHDYFKRVADYPPFQAVIESVLARDGAP